jgi:hypothetical protein
MILLRQEPWLKEERERESTRKPRSRRKPGEEDPTQALVQAVSQRVLARANQLTTIVMSSWPMDTRISMLLRHLISHSLTQKESSSITAKHLGINIEEVIQRDGTN